MTPPSLPKSPFSSPFASTASTKPGHGEVVVSLLPPSLPTLSTLSYKYPLKLITRKPATTLNSKHPDSATTPVHLYLLTYGGGLLPGDHIEVSITLQPRMRLVLTTPQGSQKIYKTETGVASLVQERARNRSRTGNAIPDNKDAHMSRQTLDVKLGSQSGLCYLPDPTQPFEDSQFEQIQRFTLLRNQQPHTTKSTTTTTSSSSSEEPPAINYNPSLCVLDWVTQGRTARGEDWSFHSWKGRNEVWSEDVSTGKRRLLLRDNVMLEEEVNTASNNNKNADSGAGGGLFQPLSIRTRTRPHGILGTFVLHGPLFDSLANFLMEEFTSQPRIGGRNWSASAPTTTSTNSNANADPGKNVMWTAARVRGDFVLVKFGAKDFESAREWLGGLVRREGSVVGEFGDEGLGCL
ncbi:hypothetical protein AJ79_04125 [Helicocarpus griseus UAMH5409]|uniref:Urease accessory protein UreD n=1 Tax=Helicocarpus griseus UAMH5409 TaxID=1447875 RepID=A0A2B7XVU7_9EURO|nr:hypothetical protein AJ79_04125 [Helicocarpus griseus UAMH5409]